MKIFRLLALVLIVVYVVIQFIPDKIPENKPENENHIINSALINEDVLNILKTSCFDCHSDQTDFPWYSKIAPSSWFLADHINDAKAELNFSEWDSLSRRKKISMLEDIREEVSSGAMPLKSYLLIHRKARLTPDELASLVKWTEESAGKVMNDK